MRAPLVGVKTVEFGSIGPGPFAASLLAELGADVIRLQRSDDTGPVDMADTGSDKRARPFLEIDLKSADGRDTARGLALSADAGLEAFRPGVMERLGPLVVGRDGVETTMHSEATCQN